MASDGSIKITTELDSKAAEKALSKFSSVAKTGLKGVTVAVGAVSTALTGAAGYAINTGIDFESAFAGVKKTVDATDAELDEFRQGIRDMAKEMPQSASQIAEVAEAAGQLGIENKNMLSFTEVMSNLGVATNMSATEAATSLARLANITQMPQENFDRLGSTIVALGNNLATTESEITEMGLRLAGAGKQVGMSEDQILGLAGAISSVGIEADAGGSAVSTVMTKMQLAVEQGGESLEQFADVAGMSASEFQQAFREDAAQALVSFVEGLGSMDERGKSAIATLSDMEITEIRQRDALLRLAGAGDVLSESLGIASNAWTENTALTKEAEQRYETLESRLQILKNNVSDLGITFYDSIRDPLKNTVDEGIAYVDRLCDAFDSGGLSSAVSAAGGIFADMAVEVASHAPDMVNSAVQFIQSFASGIYANRGQILSAAGSIATALGEGLADLLPASVSGPVKAAGDELGESFENGGLRTAISTVSSVFEKFSTIVGKVSKVTLPPLTKALDLVGGNLDTVVPLVAAGVTAFKSYNAITKTVTSATKAFNVASKVLNAMEKANALQLVATNGGLTIQQTLIALRNKQITVTTALTGLWAKAQNALNVALSANPIGLAVTVIAALAATIGTAVLMTDKASASTAKLTEKQKESIDASKEAKKSIEEEAEARQKNINASTAEIDNAEALWGELQKCVDANGHVKAGYEARAQYITGELSNALGTEISLTDGVIQNYADLESSIYDVIASKKAEAVLNAMQDDYTTAIRDQAEKAEELANAYENLNGLNERRVELEAEAAELESSTNYGDASRYAEVKEELAGINAELEVAQADFDKYNTAMQDNQKVISDYNLITEAAMSGSTEAINNALAEIQSGIDTALEAGSSAALEQAQTTGDSLLSILSAQESGLEDLEQSTIDSSAEAMGIALNTISTSSENMKQFLESAGADGAQRLLAAMKNADLSGNLSTEAKSGMEAMIAAMDSMDDAFYETGVDSGDEYASGVESQSEPARSSGKTLATSADDGASSITGYNAGVNFGTGFSSGIRAAVAGAVASAASLAAQALASAQAEIDSHSPSKKTMKLGKYFGQGFELGISGEEKAVGKASENLADAALKAIDTAQIMDQIRSLDIADTIGQINDAMSDTNIRISDRVTAKMEASDRASANSNLVCTLSEADMSRLLDELSKVSERPVIVYTTVNDRVIAKTIASPMKEEIDKLEKAQNRKGGIKS